MVVLEEGKSLYDAMGVAKDASSAEIRKAYLKLAVQLHPDKNSGDAAAKDRFQTLQKVYAVLIDADKRKVYDRTGSLEDSEQLSGDQFDSLYAFYRDMYTPVTEADLDAFHLKYRGSEEERAEVLRYYARYRGNMGLVFMSVMCSDPDRDSHRFMDIVDAAVAAGEAAAPSKNYKAWAKKTAALPRPADPLAPPKKEKAKGKKGGGGDSEAALVAQIRGKQAQVSSFESMLAQIESKYGGGGKPKAGRKRAAPAEPTDEEFEAARRRIEERKAAADGKPSGSKAAGRKGAKK